MNQLIVEQALYKMLSEGLGLDMKDPNLRETPKRIAKMYCNELFSGLTQPPPLLTLFPNSDDYDEMVMIDNIPFTSVCSHHFLPFQGLAWFLYIPGPYREGISIAEMDLFPQGELIGASKIPRLIQHYAARPQLQERLTQQIMEHFVEVVHPRGAMLVMRATHGCMTSRGVKIGNNAGMTTSKVYGSFKENPATRQEGLELIKLSRR